MKNKWFDSWSEFFQLIGLGLFLILLVVLLIGGIGVTGWCVLAQGDTPLSELPSICFMVMRGGK